MYKYNVQVIRLGDGNYQATVSDETTGLQVQGKKSRVETFAVQSARIEYARKLRDPRLRRTR